MRKLFLIPMVIITLPIIIFIAAGTPLILGFVKQKIEQTVGDNLGIPMKIGSMSGNLFFVLRAEDIEVPGLGRIAETRITYNPFGLLSRYVDIRSVRIDGIELDVDRLVEVLGTMPKKADSLPSKPFPLKIQIEKFSIAEGGIGLKLGQAPLNMVLSSRGMLLHDRLIVDSLHIETRRSVAVLKGVVPLVKAGDLDLVFDIDLAAEDLGVPVLSGGLASTGTVKGKFPSPVVVATTRLSARIMENDVNGVVGLAWRLPYFDSLNVKADLRLTTATLQRGIIGYDTWDVKMLLERTRISADVLSRYGKLQANGMLKGKVSRPRFEGAISGRFDYQGFRPSFEGQIQYGDDILKIAKFKMKSRRLSVELGLRFDHREKSITESKLDLYCSDLSVLNSITGLTDSISGELWLTVSASGAFGNPDARASLRLANAAAFGEFMTEASFHASMANAVARLDSGIINSRRGLIDLEGFYDMKQQDFRLRLRSDRLVFKAPEMFRQDTLMISGVVGMDVILSGNVANPQGEGEFTLTDVGYDTLQFGDYNLEFSLRDTLLKSSLVNEQGNAKIRIQTFLQGDFPFEAEAGFENFVLNQFLHPVSGSVTADVSAHGFLSDLVRTQARLRFSAVEFVSDGNKIENLNPVIVLLEDEILRVQTCTLVVVDQRVYVEGSLPLDFDNASMDISAKSSKIQISEIAYLLPGTPSVAGNLQFDIRVQGKPQQLDIDGNLVLDNANYTIKDVSFDSVSGRFLFRNGLVICETFSGKINKGRFKANGFADLSHGRLDTMLFKVDLDRFNYANKDFGRVLIDAALRASSRKDSLRISGEIIVVEGVYDAPMKLQKIVGLLTAASRPVPQQPEMAKRIYCDIGIVAPDSIVIANNIANLSVRADLQVKGYLSRLNAYGTISAINEGTVKYLGKKFTIVNAVIQFDDPYKIDPVIDLVAISTISAADGDYEVSLVLSGTVNAWQLVLSSNPPLPQQDIVSLLLIGQRRPGPVGSTVTEIDMKGKVKDYAFDAVRYGIEKSGEQLLGLDKFTISGELNDPSSMRVGIEKSIVKGFKLIYSTGIESWELHQVGASYDITDHISIFTLYDQDNLNTSVDLDFHFSIK
jgi:hypothetical protein